jgi:hypothetical protein
MGPGVVGRRAPPSHSIFVPFPRAWEFSSSSLQRAKREGKKYDEGSCRKPKDQTWGDSTSFAHRTQAFVPPRVRKVWKMKSS